MSSPSIRPVAIAFAISLAGCTAARQQPAVPRLGAGEANVSVLNDSDDDVGIYAVGASGTRRRLGTVMRTSRGEMAIPADLLRSWDVQLLAVPIGGGVARPFSCPLKIQPGIPLRLRLDRNPVLWSCRRE